jgi:phage terminase large subunit-like protein
MAQAAGNVTFAAIADEYAAGVIGGRIPACRWVRRACERYTSDVARSALPDAQFTFQPAKVEKVCRFIETLPHIKGKWKTLNLKLEPWQVFIIANVFGFINPDGTRRCRTVYIEVPRKNGKSSFTAAVALYMLTLDGEKGAEVYSAATTRDQAKIVFGVAKEMARRSKLLREKAGVQIGAHNMHVLSSASKFEALSAEGNTLDGLNIHFGGIDELHAHKTRAVFDVLETATGARAQPIIWSITTAGSNRAGICYEQRTYLTKLLDGVAEDDTYFGIIYTTDDGDDWADPATWAKANPNLGVSVLEDDLARKCKKAMEMPSAQNNFLTKHLDVWVNADVAWMDMRAWDKCADPSLEVEDFEGQECIGSLDLASKTDIAPWCRLFWRDIEGVRHYYGFLQYYLPEETIENNANSQYSGWQREGRLIATEGNVTDIDRIEDDIKADAGRFQLREVAFDPWQAQQLANHMIGDGLTMVEMRPTVQNFSAPMKELEALVLTGRFHHDGDPVLAWMVSNVVAHTDNKDNIYPRKERPENKIDGVVALIMALGRAMTGAPSPSFGVMFV